MSRHRIVRALGLLSLTGLLSPAPARAGPGIRVDFTADMNGPSTSATASGTLGIFDPTLPGPFALVLSQMTATVMLTAPSPDTAVFTPTESISTHVGLEFTMGGPQLVDLQALDDADDFARFEGVLDGSDAELEIDTSNLVFLSTQGPFSGANGPIQYSFAVLDCGDAVLQAGEQCDDGSVALGDGCDAACRVEPGWVCGGGPPSSCAEVCGDGLVVGVEECDDGGTVDGDGCDALCRLEPATFTPVLDPFVEVADVNPDLGGTLAIRTEQTVLGGEYYFEAYDGLNGQELWKSDGTAAGTQLAVDIGTGNDAYRNGPEKLTAVGDTLYFLQDTGLTKLLWASDGTQAGTQSLGPFFRVITDRFTELAGDVIFTGTTTGTGIELWRTDGTAAGTTLVADINPGSASSNPDYFTPVGGELLFTARDAVGSELRKTDGTGPGTQVVKDIQPSGSSQVFPLIDFGGLALFGADSGTIGRELWRSDGTEPGTVLVKEIAPGPADSDPEFLGTLPGAVVLLADDGVRGEELWRTDGTAAGTTLIADLAPGPASAGISSFVDSSASAGGLLYFTRTEASTGEELWRTDGTAAGTFLVKDIEPGPDSGNPDDLLAVGEAVLFLAQRVGSPPSVQPSSIWVTRGEADSTLPLAVPGRFELDFGVFAATDDFVFFNATDADEVGDLFALPRRCCAFLASGDAAASVLGGAGTPGGIDMSFSSVDGGALIAEYHEVPIAELKFALPSPAAVNFAFPSDPVPLWHLEPRGGAIGVTMLSFGYDDTDVADEGALTLHQLAAPGSWVALAATLDPGADTIGAQTAILFSSFVLGAGPASPTLALAGTAQGGLVRVSIGAVPLEVPTQAGQSAAAVAAALAAAIQADAYLASQGVGASASGGVLTVTGGVLSFQEIQDAGLSAPPSIPALPLTALALLALLVGVLARFAASFS